MYPFLQSSEKIPDFRQFWNIIQSGFIMVGLLSFRILVELQSYPWPLVVYNGWVIFSSFSLSKVISFSLFSVQYVFDFGRVLLFCRGWHCLLKNLFNNLAFSKKLMSAELKKKYHMFYICLGSCLRNIWLCQVLLLYISVTAFGEEGLLASSHLWDASEKNCALNVIIKLYKL